MPKNYISNSEESIRLFKSGWMELAKKGDVKAQYNIGRCYARGNGTDVDLIEANAWYLKAAEQNDPRAYHNLSMLYEDDKFQQRDIEKSKYYFEKAFLLGEPRAIVTHQKNELDKKQKEDAAIKEKKRVDTNALIKSIEYEFEKKDFKSAEAMLLKASEAGHGWASATLCALSLDIKKTNIESEKNSESYTGPAIVNGNTSTISTTTRHYIAVVEIKNNSNYSIETIYINDGKYSYDQYGSLSANNQKVIRVYSTIYKVRVSMWLKNNDGVGEYELSMFVPLQQPITVPKAVSGLSTCFVLTACFESEDAETVKKFRDFRDEYLSKSSIGRYFIKWYYFFIIWRNQWLASNSRIDDRWINRGTDQCLSGE